MGEAKIPMDVFPRQTEMVGQRAAVTLAYGDDTERWGTIVRSDAEAPFLVLIRLDDGRYVWGGRECTYNPFADEPESNDGAGFVPVARLRELRAGLDSGSRVVPTTDQEDRAILDELIRFREGRPEIDALAARVEQLEVQALERFAGSTPSQKALNFRLAVLGLAEFTFVHAPPDSEEERSADAQRRKAFADVSRSIADGETPDLAQPLVFYAAVDAFSEVRFGASHRGFKIELPQGDWTEGETLLVSVVPGGVA